MGLQGFPLIDGAWGKPHSSQRLACPVRRRVGYPGVTGVTAWSMRLPVRGAGPTAGRWPCADQIAAPSSPPPSGASGNLLSRVTRARPRV